ncbi:unnamed protein product, partial [Phaeothamnion confervicola]
LASECFPIPLGPRQMDPRLLLRYALERTVPLGRDFRRLTLSRESQWLWQCLFWWTHCRFFQPCSGSQQDHLRSLIGGFYIRLLALLPSGRGAAARRGDTFFAHYPLVMASAAYWGFHYLCPGTRHLYGGPFKRLLALRCGRLLWGVNVAPVTIRALHARLFPDEPLEGDNGGGDSAGGDDGSGISDDDHLNGNGGKVGAHHSGMANERGDGAALLPSPPPAPPILTMSDPSHLQGASPPPDLPFAAAAGAMAIVVEASAAGATGRWGAASGGEQQQRRCGAEAGAVARRIRQQRGVFDASGVSQLLQCHARLGPHLCGRREERILCTAPARRCDVGGTDTFRRHPTRKDERDAIATAAAAAAERAEHTWRMAARQLRRELKELDAEARLLWRHGRKDMAAKSSHIVQERKAGL